MEYSLAVMEELRAAAEDGFQKIPHGGIEVGAILFGTHEEGRVRILEWRPIPCEHQRGPGFVLSENDRARLAALLAECAAQPELRGLEPVGWFHTHTRSGMFLSAEDVALFDQFFPEAWQVSLVMVCAKHQTTKAGFFCRETDGTLLTEASHKVFPVEFNPAAAAAPRRASAAPVRSQPLAPKSPPPAAERERLSRFEEPAPVPASQPAPGYENLGVLATGLHVVSQTNDAAAAAGGAAPREKGPASAREPEVIPLPNRAPGDARIALHWKVLGAVACLAVLSFLGRALWNPKAPPASVMRIEDHQNEILVLWDHSLPVIRRADRGLLRIIDGRNSRSIPLDMIAVRRGSVTYARESGDVEIRLTVYEQGKELLHEQARYVGQPVTRPILSTEQDRKQLEEHAARIRQALVEEEKRGARLREELRLATARQKAR